MVVINAVEMRSPRSMCGVPRKDRCRNSDVRERCDWNENVVTRVEKVMLRWFGHLERINEKRVKKQVFIANVYNGKSYSSCLRNPFSTTTETPSVFGNSYRRAGLEGPGGAPPPAPLRAQPRSVIII
ncbi:hypothetical protein EVAR_103516_1 [Eumeta japonica]|uniref:Uncharacterized protein n=1 Tax=Eumeta variegata TaxID=151549 RepID=A0A4C1YRJ2_EUMVA|nr:hypothetical protein EVAR_103516_1 [Eumeta japonica]